MGESVSLIIGCAARGDDVYLSWTGDTGGGSWDVWVAHSSDRGVSWAAPVRVNDDVGSAHQVRAWIGVDAANRVHAAWIDWRTGAPEPWSAWSADGGATWSPNEIISEGKAGESGPDYNGLAVSAEGEVALGWADNRDPATGIDIYFAKRRASPR